MSSRITDGDFYECEQRLVAALGRAVLPDELWGRLMREGYVLPAIREGNNSAEWRQLEEAARAFSQEAREADTGTNFPPAGRDRGPQKTAGSRLDDYTLLRAEVFSEVVGTLADKWTEVRRFRDIYLGDVEARLADAEAAAWLFGGEATVGARQDMREISRRLCRAYRWREREADWFLLTGHVPFVRPINVLVRRNHHRDAPSYLNKHYWLPGYAFPVETAEIIITAEPWVDARIVSRAFEEVQKQIRGGDNRKITTKVLDAVRFVARRLETGKTSWPEHQAAWKQARPEKHYKSRNGLYKAFRRFLQPEYNAPAYPDYEPTPAQRWEEKYRRRKAEAVFRQPKETRERHGPPKAAQD